MSDDANIEALLKSGCSALEVTISREQKRAVLAYVQLLAKWNQRINLVGVRDVRRLVRLHIVDSLAVTRWLPSGPGTLIDVGSGAGLPGALVAIVRPDLQVTALEPIHKKQAFISTVRRELSLNNLRPLAERMEIHMRREAFEPYDMAVSRAAFALPEWLSRARALVKEGGTILAMEGREPQELPPGSVRRTYELEDRTRAIIIAQVRGTAS